MNAFLSKHVNFVKLHHDILSVHMIYPTTKRSLYSLKVDRSSEIIDPNKCYNLLREREKERARERDRGDREMRENLSKLV